MEDYSIVSMGSMKEAYFDILREYGFEQSDSELYRVIMAIMGMLEIKGADFYPDLSRALLEVYNLMWDVRDEKVLQDRFVGILKHSRKSNKKLAQILGVDEETVKGLKIKKYAPDYEEIDRLVEYYDNEYEGYSSMEAYLFDLERKGA